MSERGRRSELILVPSIETANTVNTVFDALHPPSHIVSASALYVLGGTARTVDVANLRGWQLNNTGLYNQLFRSDAITQVLKPKSNPRIQEATFTPFAVDIRYPELCVLTMHWLAENDIHKIKLLHGSGSVSSKFGLLTEAYLQNTTTELPERTRRLLQQTTELSIHTYQSKTKDTRLAVRNSLRTDGLALNTGTNSVALTPMGAGFVREVVVPYSMLLVDKEAFATRPDMQTARQRLLIEPDTYPNDRAVFGTRLRSFNIDRTARS